MDDSIRDVRGADAASPELDSLVPPTRLDRRGFIAGSAAAGFAASVVPTGALLAQMCEHRGVRRAFRQRSSEV